MLKATSKRNKEKIFEIILITGSFFMLYPFIWTIISSFKSESEIFTTNLLNFRFNINNYREVLLELPFIRWLLNSLIVTLAIVLMNVIICSLSAYSFARLKFPGKNIIFVILISSLMIPKQILLIPMFIILNKINLLDTYAGLILPFIALPFGIFLLRQFILAMPIELEEAGKIDGCGVLRNYWHIILPQMSPAIATLVIIIFVGNWGEFLFPLVIIQSGKMFTLPIGLETFSSQMGTKWGALLTSTVLADLPIIIWFFLMQKKFISGLAEGAVKG